MEFKKIWISGLNLSPKDIDIFHKRLKNEVTLYAVGGTYGINLCTSSEEWNKDHTVHTFMVSNEIPYDCHMHIHVCKPTPSIQQYLKDNVTKFSEIKKYKETYQHACKDLERNINKYLCKYHPDYLLRINQSDISLLVKHIVENAFEMKSVMFTTSLSSVKIKEKHVDKESDYEMKKSSPPIKIPQKKIKILENIGEI